MKADGKAMAMKGSNIGKIDVVMWTKNAGKIFSSVLCRIDEVIPKDYICHKVIIDDSSTDDTKKIAQSLGWTVYHNEKGGIANGANQALTHVHTEVFMSVEQDVVLAKDWWTKVAPIMINPNVACVQGIRITANKAYQILEDWENKTKTLMSIDNNLFRTKVIRDIGGFPTDCPQCVDTVLRNIIVEETCYKWEIVKDAVSDHLRSGTVNTLKHNNKSALRCVRTKYCRPPKTAIEDASMIKMLRLLATSPIRAIQIATRKNCPTMVWLYPIIRLYSVKIEISRKAQKARNEKKHQL
jgi:hypothetical protein